MSDEYEEIVGKFHAVPRRRIWSAAALRWRLFFCALSVLMAMEAAWGQAETDAIIEAELLKLSLEDTDARQSALMALAETGNPRVEYLLEAFRIESLFVWNGKVVVCEEFIEDDDFNEFAPLMDPLSGQPILENGEPLVVSVDDLEEISPSRSERRFAQNAKFLIRLSSTDADARLSGAKKCGDPPGIPASTELLRSMADNDPDVRVRRAAIESLELINLFAAIAADDEESMISAADALGQMGSLRAFDRVSELLANESALPEDEQSAEAKKIFQRSVWAIERYQSRISKVGNLFRGISLGSVLILMALGLAITFGLMGVINMAHGELMMIGAYTTFEIQRIVGHTPDAPQNWYFFVALPSAFLVSALVGALMEVLVVRHLYRRPLESLLATWGVGLILIQAVRVRYGDNIGVNAPEWARGSWEVVRDLNFPYSRLFIVGLCAACVAATYLLMRGTSLGLQMRATMQNRDMAAGLGINTSRVDRYTFAFGSGLAGVAGCAWTLVGGVTPDMGQTNFIVDAFLVVVTGGVGELIGVVCSGLGIGVLTKVLEPMEIASFPIGAVWSKVLLLIAIVIFIQFRPSGLFAQKGRLSDD
jgi:urea transport system permease protein